jgi:hypothetical protein
MTSSLRRINTYGYWELYCVTCSAWCGDDEESSGHLGSTRHRSWETHFQKQQHMKNFFIGTPAESVGTPSHGCCGPPQRASGVWDTHEAETPDLVTHEQLQLKFEQIQSCGRHAEQIHEAALKKICIKQQQQEVHQRQQEVLMRSLLLEITVLQKQNAKLATQNATINLEMLNLRRSWIQTRTSVGQIQDFLGSCEEA